MNVHICKHLGGKSRKTSVFPVIVSVSVTASLLPLWPRVGHLEEMRKYNWTKSPAPLGLESRWDSEGNEQYNWATAFIALHS